MAERRCHCRDDFREKNLRLCSRLKGRLQRQRGDVLATVQQVVPRVISKVVQTNLIYKHNQTYRFNFELNKGANDKGEGGKKSSDGHLLQWAVADAKFCQEWVNGVLKDGNHENDEKWVNDLNLVRLYGKATAHLTVHASRLKSPPTGLLVKEGPEDGQGQVEKENGHQGAHVVNCLALFNKKIKL